MRGAAATAMVGATLADWARQREEERRRMEEERRRRAEEGGGNITARRLGLKAQEDAVRDRWADQKAEKARQEAYNQHMEEKMTKLDAIDDAKWTASQVLIAQREKEKDKAAYDHRMDEHSGEQDKVDKWNDEQHQAGEHEDIPSEGGFDYLKKLNPFPWLSISGEAGLEKNLFSDTFIGVTNINRGIGEIFLYEEQSLKVSNSVMGTRNPSGTVDINITKGDLTLDFGNNLSIFVNVFNGTAGITKTIPDKNNPSIYIEETAALDYDWNWGWMKHSFITSKTTVNIDEEYSNDEFIVENRFTSEGEINTVKTTGVMASAVVVVAAVYGLGLLAGAIDEFLGGLGTLGGILQGVH